MSRSLTTTAIDSKNSTKITADWLVESSSLGLALSYAFTGAGSSVSAGIPWQSLYPPPLGEQYQSAFGAVQTTIGPTTWEHRILRLSEVEHSVPPGGGVGAVSSFDADIVENGEGMSLRKIWNDKELLEGQPITLSLLFAGESYANKIPIFAGKIDKAFWRSGRGTLQAVDTSLPSDLLLPRTTVTRVDFAAAPDQTVNAALPIVYGNGGVGRLELAPLLLVNGATLLTYRAAGHPLKSLGQRYGVWPQGGRRLLTANTPLVNSSMAEMILLESVAATIFKDPANQTLQLVRAMDVATPEHALDENPASLAIIGTDDNLDPNGNGLGMLGVEVGLVNPEGVNIVTVDLLQHRRSVDSDTRVHANLVLRLIDSTKLVVLNNLWTSPTFRHTSTPRDDQFTIRNVAMDGVHTLEAVVQVVNEGGYGDVTNTYEVGTLHMEVGYQPSSALEQIYADSTEEAVAGITIPWTNLYPPPLNEQYTYAFPGVFGPEAPVVLSGRLDEDGTITGTPGNHIDNPADVVRSIFVQEMGRNVDTASFNAARTALSGQFFDGGIGAGWSVERLQARQLLNDLAVQAHGYVLPSATDAFKMVVYDAAAASHFNFTQFHILMTGDPNTPAAERSLQSSFDVQMSDMALVANTFRVRHGWHPGLRQFTKVCYASPGGSNHPTLAVELTAKCADSAERYGDLPPREIDAYWISHDDTAYALLEHLVNYFWTQHCIVSFLTTLCACHLEPTDHVTLNHPEIPDLLDGARFEVIRTRFSPSEGTVFLICQRSVTLSFQYFAIKSQDGNVWYFWVANDRTLHWSDEPPTSFIKEPIDLDLDPIPYWLEVESSDSETWFIFPTDLGEPTAETAAPPQGPGRIGSPVLRGIPPGTWQIIATPIVGEVDVRPA